MSRARRAWERWGWVVPAAVLMAAPALPAWVTGTDAWWSCAHRWVGMVGDALAGLAGAAVGGHLRGTCRDLGMRPRDARLRAAVLGALLGGFVAFAPSPGTPGAVPLRVSLQGCLVVSAIFGFMAGLGWGFLTGAERAFARAVRLLREGDREGAREAIRQYLRKAKSDPAYDTHLPLAERFLEDDEATLETPAELEAAPAPEGRGTELEGAAAPAGRGSELQAESEQPEGLVPGRETERAP